MPQIVRGWRFITALGRAPFAVRLLLPISAMRRSRLERELAMSALPAKADIFSIEIVVR